ILVQADLARESDLGHIFPEIETKLGVPHILINNASAFEPDPEDVANRDVWDRHMNVNLRAPYYLSHELHKRIGKDGRGHIINMVDQRVLNLTPYFESYSYSKSALWAMTQTMALSFAPNIQVNAIGPGPTLANSRQSALDFQAQYESLPLQRATPLEDISNAILFLLNSSSITGEIITLDGGEHLGWCQENLSSPILE
ncbi:MAG: SDR family oxidoreductase, partial [Alphaproteobacteria bacterium]|nr:SDR family oxidoreductase [Alphaproteobacteria bacterium]